MVIEDPLKPRTLVDHLDQEPVLIKRGAKRDRAVSVEHRVIDELGDQQLRRVELVAGQRRRIFIVQASPRP